MKLPSRKYLPLIPLALVLLNFIVKVIFLSGNSIAQDEPYSIYVSQMDIKSIIKFLAAGNNPPLYEIILHFWIKVFGLSEFSVRFPSLIFSCVAVYYFYKFGEKYLNIRIAIYAALLFIFSNYHIIYAHQARVYSLQGMLTIMSMYYFLGVIISGKQKPEAWRKMFLGIEITKDFLWLVIVNLVMIYSHYFGFYVLVTQVLFVMFIRELRVKHWKKLLLASVVLLVLYVPNIYVFFHRFIESSVEGTWVQPPKGFKTMYSIFAHLSNNSVNTVMLLLVFAVAITKFVIRRKQEKVSLPVRLVIVWFVFIFFFMYGISFVVPMFLGRYVMPAAMGLILVIAISIDYLISKKWLRYAVPLVVIGLFIISAKPNYPNYRKVTQTIDKVKEIMGPEDKLMVFPRHFLLNFTYYYDRDIFMDYDTADFYTRMLTSLAAENVIGVRRINEVDYSQWDHIIYLNGDSETSGYHKQILELLKKDYDLKDEYLFRPFYTIHVLERKQEGSEQE